ncbi:MAG: DNA-3-methyladenine glycosylase [Defluviicoccus sp.]|nr:DNA-3-methyladenine glycosylase [Defluviicoccus sp.]
MQSPDAIGPGTHAPPFWEQACHELRQIDPTLANLIRTAQGSVLGPRNDAFFSLSRSIVAQQLSIHAAEAVWQRLMARVGSITPCAVSRYTEEDLRKCGLSRPKARYLLCLAEHFTDQSLKQIPWRSMDNEAVVENLTQVKGIGRWTAEMFLIFHLLRPDVLPTTDVGIQRAMAKHFNDGVRPTPEEMTVIAQPWRPWRSVASWYLWRSLDVVPLQP